MAERKRVRRNTLERRCLGKAFKRLFVNAPKGVFKMLEKVKRVWSPWPCLEQSVPSHLMNETSCETPLPTFRT